MAAIIESYLTGEDSDLTGDGLTNEIIIGQTFTIGNTGTNLDYNLTSIDAKFSKRGTPGDLIIEIYETNPDGHPIGTAISTGNKTEASTSTTDTWYNILMSSVTLKRSTKYALVFKAVSGTSGTHVYDFRGDGSVSTYGGGSEIYSLDSGVTWTADTDDDLLFRILGGDYAGTLCTLADAVNKAGALASAAGKNESLVSDFVQQAEGFLNSATKKNWNDAYAALNDDVKYILNQTISCLAAIDIITYDMSGYTSRVEAETMINTYREEINRNLFFLLQQDNENFIVGA